MLPCNTLVILKDFFFKKNGSVCKLFYPWHKKPLYELNSLSEATPVKMHVDPGGIKGPVAQ